MARCDPVEKLFSIGGLAAAGRGAAVAARVARARPHHAAAAAVALDRVFEGVEERGLAGSRGLGRRSRSAARVPGGHVGAYFRREDPGLLLLVDVEELLAE